MNQEAMQEIDMDVFSRRIGPYFSWLESKIESGWQQSDHIPKDILKETKYLATTMRARFILGVTKPDFVKEVERALELFEIAIEAFPGESDEIESKIKHFTKGISEELGPEFLPEKESELISSEIIKKIDNKETENDNQETEMEEIRQTNEPLRNKEIKIAKDIKIKSTKLKNEKTNKRKSIKKKQMKQKN